MDSNEFQPPISTPHTSRPEPHAYILVGPTASGKSAVAQYLAEQTGSKIVSADSMNIYRGMDIGTAKPSDEERGKALYHGIDLADPTELFSVGDWLKAIKPIFNSSSAPIVAGGTGLYVKCLLAGLDNCSPADTAFRARAETMSLSELQSEAKSVSPSGYETLSDKENPRRLVRLIEQGSAPKQWKKELPKVVGLHVERKVLHARIAKRVDEMYEAGLIEEARKLMEKKLSSTAQKAIGYSEAFALLRGEMSEVQAKERTIIRTRQLAKRQMTWFRHQLNVEWINVADFSSMEEFAEKVRKVWGEVPVIL